MIGQSEWSFWSVDFRLYLSLSHFPFKSFHSIFYFLFTFIQFILNFHCARFWFRHKLLRLNNSSKLMNFIKVYKVINDHNKMFMIKRKNYRYHKFLQFKFLQSSPIYVDSCEDSYEDEDCSCDSSSSYDVLHSRYVRRRQESAET